MTSANEHEHERIAAEIARVGSSSDPFAAAMRATRMPMIITDPNRPDNPIIFLNNAFCNLTGYSQDEIINQNCRFLQGRDTDQIDLKKLRDAISSRQPVEIELLNYKKSGEEFWNRLLVSPVFDAAGKLIYFFASQYDVTLERLAQAVMRDANDKLEIRVAATLAGRTSAEEQLRQSQKMEAVGQLTGGVAHDFNNLLTVIRGSTDLLRRPDLSEEKRKKYINAISDTADRAAKLTNQLLAFARRQALMPEQFDAVQSIRNIRDMLSTLLGSQMTIELELRAEPCFIDADRSQFETSIVNMAANARDAMNGAGELRIKVDAVSGMPANRSHPFTSGEFVTIALSDQGEGIAPDQISRIFEPFFTTKNVGEGTGLGLSQVFGFAKQSGGDVRVDSIEGKGSTFTIYLPLVSAPLDPGNAESIKHKVSFGQGACILVVEDNAEVGEFATLALSELGYTATLAKDASSALSVLASASGGQFEVVFSDVVMPGMSGIELGLILREKYPHLPVILTSGYSDVIAETGPQGFELLRKPYSIDELSQVLRKVADKTPRRDQ